MDERTGERSSDDQREDVLASVTDHYLTSHDFNGIPPDHVAESVELALEELKETLRQLIQDELVSINSAGNFHIKTSEPFRPSGAPARESTDAEAAQPKMESPSASAETPPPDGSLGFQARVSIPLI